MQTKKYNSITFLKYWWKTYNKKQKYICISLLFWWNDQCYFIFWGRQHRRVFIFCQCEAEVITLIRHQLWPSTPTSPTIAFHFELMKWYYGLLLEGHVSLKSFCAGLSTRQSKHEKGYTNREAIDLKIAKHSNSII